MTRIMPYRLKFIDHTRFMASLWRYLVNNLTERIHEIKCKHRYNDRKYETFTVKYKYCKCCIEHTSVIVDLIKCKCLCCHKY